ncbi:hypothetical protein GCM10010116_38280 [Microbispora rosea subsp. aerata]|nr:hypothetical protein GCM10010116_38280 [Microbispora rosea subsp. aerata]GIH54274.1 hypothetical protein Mro02_11880 [Microbispora rosea subsp. aerata]GLJ81547.1 hypothetical protein GCM10017588_02710 [Microbispora rosea subsp. aerata]
MSPTRRRTGGRGGAACAAVPRAPDAIAAVPNSADASTSRLLSTRMFAPRMSLVQVACFDGRKD